MDVEWQVVLNEDANVYVGAVIEIVAVHHVRIKTKKCDVIKQNKIIYETPCSLLHRFGMFAACAYAAAFAVACIFFAE